MGAMWTASATLRPRSRSNSRQLRSLFAEQQLFVAEIYNTERHQQTVVARKP
jgi:hypothetical protein